MFEFFLVPAIIIFIGIIFILIAAGTKRQGKKKLAVCTAETKGTVVRWLHKKTINDYADSVDDIWFPVYAYDVEGKHYELNILTNIQRVDNLNILFFKVTIDCSN